MAAPDSPPPPYGAPPAYPAHPAQYEYAYAVKDDYAAVDFDAQEKRDGDATEGGYRVVLPDGRTQVRNTFFPMKTKILSNLFYHTDRDLLRQRLRRRLRGRRDLRGRGPVPGRGPRLPSPSPSLRLLRTTKTNISLPLPRFKPPL